VAKDAPGENRDITRRAVFAVGLTAAVGVALTLVITAAGFAPAYQNRALHAAKETAAALVLLLVAALLAGRFSRTGRLLDLFALAGVLVVATKNLVFSVLTAILTETSGGLTTWRTTGAGMVGAALLAVASVAPERLVGNRRRALLLTAGGSVATFVLLSAVADVFHFPGAFTDRPETRAELQLLSQHSALVVADAAASALFLIAGAAFARRAQREADEFQMWLGIGATIAGIGYLNYALFPSSYTDFLYTGDLFRIAAVVAWAIGTVRQISAYQAGYASAARLEERRRVARDLHDGVAQELAFISTQMSWFTAHPEDEETSQQITAAVQRALDESRGAISTLNRPLHEPLHRELADTAAEVTRRMGARLVLDLDENVHIPPVWEHALPRMLREAIANAVRHGSAQTVRVDLRGGDGVCLRITDDGVGFDVAAPLSENSFGLLGMKERTEALGGEFKLSSQPGHGTAVEIRVLQAHSHRP
jgi:signal transduction histidine kinase